MVPVKSVQSHKKIKVKELTEATGQAEKVAVKKTIKRKEKENVVKAVRKRAKKAEPEPEPESEPEPEPEPEPVPVPVKKVRKRVKKVEPEPEKEEEVIEEIKPKRKRAKKEPQVKNEIPTEMPAWYQKLHEGIKKEEAVHRVEKVSAKAVKLEAQEDAQKSWNDGLTRDRVAHEVDNHMSRMYSMIFAKR